MVQDGPGGSGGPSPWGAGSLGAGSRVGGYRLEERIGRGGMAVVFRARDERLGRAVALKVLGPELAEDAGFRQRFLRESRVAAAVDDPHVIPVFEAGEAGGVLFIAMRLVRGGDVRSLMAAHGRLEPGRACGIVSAVAAALDAAHAEGLVHRDVKPANLLLDGRPGRPDHVYLSDFGLGKAWRGSTGLTSSGLFLGTVDYAAPEQIEGRPVDGRADQYALGCVAFELLSGEPPFRREQGLAVMYAQLSAPPPALTDRRAGLAPPVDEVFAKVLAKSPGERFGSCGEFAGALRSALGLAAYDTGSQGTPPPGQQLTVTAPGGTARADSEPDVLPGTAAGGSGTAASQGPGGPPETTVAPGEPAQGPAVTAVPASPAPEAAEVAAWVAPGIFAAATRALPRDIASFTGRATELEGLLRTLAGAAGGGGAAGIHAIDGMAGVGKTTFAVHAAHRLAEHFPDGQFFLALHAHTPGQRPVDAADALASLLLTAGVPGPQIPPGLEARAARWRDHVAGKKILLLLDDAAGHEQVRPLLPGTAGSLVLVTSRRRLTALEDTAAISLDTLPPAEAGALLARLAGRPDLASGAGPAAEIIRLCGYLPLAIGMLAGQLRHHPAWTAAGLAAELAGARDRLAVMRAENLSVAAAFDLSYADLTQAQQRLFRRLGLVPGPSFDAHAAAALDGLTLDAARRRLNELYDQHLLSEPAPGRYLLHDLLREHARALAAADDPIDCDAATGRLLDYYLHTALSAGQHVATRTTTAFGRLPAGRPPACAPQMSTLAQAVSWLDTERPNLHAAAGHAATHGLILHAAQIPAAMSGFLLTHGHWDQATALHQTALAAARRGGDRPSQARALIHLGIVQMLTGDYPAATADLTEAVALFGKARDRPGQAYALNHLGVVQRLTGDYTAALASQRQALARFREAGDRLGQANALNQLGLGQVRTGDYAAATASLQQALALYGDISHPFGRADALNNLGIVQRMTGDHAGAIASHQQALALFRELGHRPGQAWALDELGLVLQLTGDYPAAAVSHQQALHLHRDLGHRLGQAEALNSLGELATRTSTSRQARDYHSQALAIARDLGAPLEEARALEGTGHSHLHDANLSAAAAHLRQALAIYQRIGNPGARRIQDTLGQHGL